MAPADRLRAVALALGLAIPFALIPLAQPGGDQLNLLARGWLFAEHGDLVERGNPLSSGGHAPGALTSVLVGAPLALWRDHRAPIVLIALFHVAALLLLDRGLRGLLSPVERAAFAVIYALSPWRVEAASFLWNPNYLFLAGALHLVTARAMASSRRFGATFVHVATLGLAAQLHPSMLLLGALSVLLWIRGLVRVAWGGLSAGVAVVALSLATWLARLGAAAGAATAAGPDDAFAFRGLLYLQPLLKGVSYWFRYPSLLLGRRATGLDFGERLGPGVDAWLTPALFVASAVAGFAVAAFVLWSTVRLLRERLPRNRGRHPEPGGRGWLADYVALAFVATVLVLAAAPTTPQSWQLYPIFHASALAVALGAGELAAARGEASVRKLLVAASVSALVFHAALALGGAHFRCEARASRGFALRSWSPMFGELGLQESCPWPLEQPGGWWPDVLPEQRRPERETVAPEPSGVEPSGKSPKAPAPPGAVTRARRRGCGPRAGRCGPGCGGSAAGRGACRDPRRRRGRPPSSPGSAA